MPTTQQLHFYGLKPGNIVHQGADCHICLEKVFETVVTSCRHIFCWECLLRWLLEHTSCPTCREDLHAARTRQWERDAAPASSTISNALIPPIQHPGRTLSNDGITRSSIGDLQGRELAQRQPLSTIDNRVQDRDSGTELSRIDMPSTTETLRIDARKMVQSMRVKATSLAYESGLRYNPDYMAAAKAVAARWKPALESRSGSTMAVDDVMKLLRNGMVEALYDGGFIRRNAVEDIPRALTEYLYQVVRAAASDE